jgi:hypothetical protein
MIRCQRARNLNAKRSAANANWTWNSFQPAVGGASFVKCMWEFLQRDG